MRPSDHIPTMFYGTSLRGYSVQRYTPSSHTHHDGKTFGILLATNRAGTGNAFSASFLTGHCLLFARAFDVGPFRTLNIDQFAERGWHRFPFVQTAAPARHLSRRRRRCAASASCPSFQRQPAGGVVGGEWTYESGISYQGALQGISSSGLGIFGPGDRFPGANLAGPLDPDGLQYGLLSAGDNTATGNGGVLGSDGLIKNSVIFTLGSLPVTFDLFTGISNVVFQYGTALDEPHFSGTCTSNCSPPSAPVPEPGGIALPGGALAGFGLLRYRRKT
jgi:hypothetical protein